MFANDPDITTLPVIGHGAADIAVRTACGQAARWDGGDPEALIDFVGDTTLKVIDGVLHRRETRGDGNIYAPVVIPRGATCVFRPPAGDWVFLTAQELRSQYAIHVPDAVTEPVQASVAKTVDKPASARKK
jgi:hypothetical protein